MLLPIYDDNPRLGFPYAATSFLVVHVTVSALTLAGFDLGGLAAFGYGTADPERGSAWHADTFGAFTAVLVAVYLVWQSCHLWVFADNVEDRVGVPIFIVAYLAIGGLGWLVAGGSNAVVHGGFVQATTSAMLATYTVLFPRQQVLCVVLYSRWGRSGGPQIRAFGLGFVWIAFGLGQILTGWLLDLPVLPVLLGGAAGAVLGVVTEQKIRNETHAPLTELRDDSPRGGLEPPTASTPTRAVSTRPRPTRASPPPPASRSGAHSSTFLEASAGGTALLASERKTAQLWAAIRLDDDLRHLDRLSRLIRIHTHEPIFDITRRLRHVRGLMGVELPEETARTLAEAARALDIPSIATPWPVPPLEPRLRISSVAWTQRSIALVATGESDRTFDIPWRRIRVAAGTRVSRRGAERVEAGFSLEDWNRFGAQSDSSLTLPNLPARHSTRIDLLVEPSEAFNRRGDAPPIHLSIEEGRCRYAIDAASGGFAAVARALCDQSSVLATNPGLEKIATGGGPITRWGYLEFASEKFRGDYLAWLAALAHPRHRGGGPGSSREGHRSSSEISFLE